MIQIKANTDLFHLEMEKMETKKKTKDILLLLAFVFIAFGAAYLVYFFIKKINKIEKVKTEINALNIEQNKQIISLKKTLLDQIELIKNNNSNFLNQEEDIKVLKEFNLSRKEQWESFKDLFNKIVTQLDNPKYYFSDALKDLLTKQGQLLGHLDDSHEGIIVFDTETEEIIKQILQK